MSARHTSQPRKLTKYDREPDEWTIHELAHHLGMPETTLYTWVQQGRLSSSLVPGQGRPVKLVHADEAEIAMLKAIRATPAPWRRLPPPVTPPQSPATKS
jgi:transposase-like protein